MRRLIIYVSDGTAITAETLGHSLLTQFETVEVESMTLRFINSIDKAREAVAAIERAARAAGTRPVVFSTLIDPDIRRIVGDSAGAHFDFFESFLAPLEEELGHKSSYTTGRAHGVGYNVGSYLSRIDAVNYALHNDDGAGMQDYRRADVILVGVSRTGKTPTCLYLALHYGVFAANYPLTADDLDDHRLPPVLEPFRERLVGLSIDPERLHQIRSGRLPDSQYASLKQCRFEVRQAEAVYRSKRIPILNTDSMSVEEIAASVMDRMATRRGSALR